jgi:uridine kinase
MKGDKIIIQPHHERAAQQLAELVLPEISGATGRFIITIAGESGAGKSEIAAALAELLSEHGITSTIVQQDDYFVYPPNTNAAKRRADIAWVGTGEVRLDLMDEHLELILAGAQRVVKPLVDFEADQVGEETVELNEVAVVIVEGTFTTLLNRVHRRTFIERTYADTKEARAQRAREDQDNFLESILAIEHEIISSHRPLADYVITRDYDVIENDSKA